MGLWKQVYRHIIPNTLKGIRKIGKPYGLEPTKLSILKTKQKTNFLSSLIQDGKTNKIKNILLYISTIPLQVLTKIYKKNVPPFKKHLSGFLMNPNNEIFFITPANVEEVNDIFSDLKTTLSPRPSSSLTKTTKQLNDIIVPTFSWIG